MALALVVAAAAARAFLRESYWWGKLDYLDKSNINYNNSSKELNKNTSIVAYHIMILSIQLQQQKLQK